MRARKPLDENTYGRREEFMRHSYRYPPCVSSSKRTLDLGWNHGTWILHGMRDPGSWTLGITLSVSVSWIKIHSILLCSLLFHLRLRLDFTSSCYLILILCVLVCVWYITYRPALHCATPCLPFKPFLTKKNEILFFALLEKCSFLFYINWKIRSKTWRHRSVLHCYFTVQYSTCDPRYCISIGLSTIYYLQLWDSTLL